MKILYKTLPFLNRRLDFCATIGIFDGVHRGHSWIIEKVIEKARRYPRCRPLVVTFFPAPEYCLKKIKHFHLSELSEKARDIKALGRVELLVLKFDKKLAGLSGAAFFEMVLRKIGLKALFVGEDFRFGKDRRHGMEALKHLLKKNGIRLERVKKNKYQGKIISSSRIRKLLREGEVEKADFLLGRAYSLSGIVVGSKGIGRLIGSPTANLRVSPYKFIPQRGVYAVEVFVKGRKYRGVCNVGPEVEVHIFRLRKNLYGKNIEIRFLRRIRDEQKFSSLQALHAQIEKDIQDCKRIFRCYASPHR